MTPGQQAAAEADKAIGIASASSYMDPGFNLLKAIEAIFWLRGHPDEAVSVGVEKAIAHMARVLIELNLVERKP